MLNIYFSLQIQLSCDLQPEGLQFLFLSLATEDEIISLRKGIYLNPLFSLHYTITSSKTTALIHANIISVQKACKRLAETQYIPHVQVTTAFLIADAPLLVETP